MELFSTLLRDLRYGFRSLWRRPAVTWVIVLTLAIGIGANTALFTFLVEGHWPRIQATDAERLFFVRTGDDGANRFGNASYLSSLSYQEALVEVGDTAHWTFTSASIAPPTDNPGHSVYGVISAVSPKFFELFGVYEGSDSYAFALGRGFRSDDFENGGERVTVIDYTYWRNHLAADPAILGKTLQIRGLPYTVVGVAPRGFENTGVPHTVYVPLPRIDELWRQKRLDDPKTGKVMTLLRLSPPASIADAREQAMARLTVVGQSLDIERPLASPRRFQLEPVEPGWSALDPSDKLLAGAAGLLLLLACANVANLMLARDAGRHREIAIQSALGAGRWRIARRQLTESALLATAGGVLSLGVNRIITHFIYTTFFTLQPIGYVAYGEGNEWRQLDDRVLLFTAIVAFLTAGLSGLPPVLRAAGQDTVSRLKTMGADRRPGQRLGGREMLVITQVTLSTVLVLTTALIGQSIHSLLHRDLGFDTAQHLILALTATPDVDETPQPLDAQREIYELARQEMLQQPGVVSATFADGGLRSRTPLQLPGRDEERLTIHYMSVGPDFFETHSLNPLYGRSFDPRDHEPMDRLQPRPGTVIVNQAFSDRFFDGEEMLGHELRLPNLKSDVPEGRFTVVGVFPNFGFVPPGQGPPPMVYLPLHQYFSGRPMLQTTVQVEGPPAAWISDLRKAAEAAHPKLSVVDVGTYDRQLSVELHRERLGGAMVSLFSLFGLLLACLGIFSAMTCAVSYRQREMGIRMAVGATGSDIGRMVLGETLRLVTGGIVLGITLALMAGQLLKSFLYGITPYDPSTFLTVSLVLTAVATTAGWWPAQRAASVDPNLSLRSE